MYGRWLRGNADVIENSVKGNKRALLSRETADEADISAVQHQEEKDPRF
jgi:hypothetical protein